MSPLLNMANANNNTFTDEKMAKVLAGADFPIKKAPKFIAIKTKKKLYFKSFILRICNRWRQIVAHVQNTIEDLE